MPKFYKYFYFIQFGELCLRAKYFKLLNVSYYAPVFIMTELIYLPAEEIGAFSTINNITTFQQEFFVKYLFTKTAAIFLFDVGKRVTLGERVNVYFICGEINRLM